MKLVYIGTYPPRECGIGTFTQNLVRAMVPPESDDTSPHEVQVIAIDDHHQKATYPPEVKFILSQEQQADYLEAANFINLTRSDVCILQHEFGIYGGFSGVYILPLLHKLNIPIIVTLHTILEVPSYNEKAILKALCNMAAKVVVMSHKAVYFLTTIYHVPAEKIALIEHGVPNISFEKQMSRRDLKLTGKKLLLTFGFISRNKGIETVIEALPEVVKKHAEVLYVVLGKTHPNVLRHSGEEYRNFLHLLIKRHHLENHVLLLNEFIEKAELFKYLSACEVYITPYIHEAQITSGTLSYAMGAGCAVVSTPYWHAAELLSDGRGRLFGFNDAEMLAETLTDLLDHPDKLQKIQSLAHEYGKTVIWPNIGKRYMQLCTDVVRSPRKRHKKKEVLIDLLLLPPFSLAHIKRLTDDTGIIQHAKFGIPNLKEGYCLDDNARALLMVMMAYKQRKDPVALRFMPLYLSYIHYMQNPDGTFRNFLSFSRNFLDDVGSEDSFGRAIWALGYLIGNAPNDAYYQTGKLIFFDAAPNFVRLTSIRGIANTIIGICHYLEPNPKDDGVIKILHTLTYTLIDHYDRNHSEDWQWFESLLAYDNGILPLALLHAAAFIQDERVAKVGLETMDFLTTHTLKDGTLSVIGNSKWYVNNGERSLYAQQPIDAMAMVLLFYQAFLLTGEKHYLNQLFSCFMWFLGENDLRMSLYDFETKGCCDGFENDGVNRNQGAESSLAYLISYITVLQAHEMYYKNEDAPSTRKREAGRRGGRETVTDLSPLTSSSLPQWD